MEAVESVTLFPDVLEGLARIKEAGLKINSETAVVSDDDKAKLLSFLRNIHGKKDKDMSSGKKITLKRKSVSELKVSGSSGATASRAKTVSVEVRKKRTYVKRSVVMEQEKTREEELQSERLREKEEKRLREGKEEPGQERGRE